jgi:disulfide bond formation protein DsbB
MYKKTILVLALLVLVLGLVACGGGGSSAPAEGGAMPRATEAPVQEVSLGDPAAGKEQYDMICIACHGPTGEGIEGLGKPFTTSTFLAEKNDAEMVEFIKTGRPSSDPLNTTGVDMPPKGGNPALTDEQILDIIAYVRTLHQ